MCPSSCVDLSAVTDIAVTPAAKQFDVIVGCNTFEGVAAKYRCAIRLFTFALSVYPAAAVLLGCVLYVTHLHETSRMSAEFVFRYGPKCM